VIFLAREIGVMTSCILISFCDVSCDRPMTKEHLLNNNDPTFSIVGFVNSLTGAIIPQYRCVWSVWFVSQ